MKILHKFMLAAAMAALLPAASWGKSSIEKYHDEILELSVEDNIMNPDIPGKQEEAIRAKQQTVAKFLKSKGFKVQTVRDGLALVVTVPASQLFAPNDTVLLRAAADALNLISHYLKTPDMYKMLVVSHSDDTGSELYLNSLTEVRSNAIVEWMSSRGLSTDAVIPYGYGADEPLESNISVRGRRANRRVEFYFIPGPQMIQLAKSKKL